jgi:cytochrome c peroxidase
MFSNKTILIFFLTVFAIVAYCFFTHSANVTNADIDKRRIELGRYLFYDRRLSINQARACATCHNPQFAFTDGYKRSLGAYADLHKRNSQTLFNLTYLKYFTAADSTIHAATQQINNPLYNTHPIEMGVNGHEFEILNRIKADTTYQYLFKQARFAIEWPSIKQAIGKFELSLNSFNSPYDKYKAGNINALTNIEKQGMELFFSNKLNCFACHGGKNFSDPSVTNTQGITLHYFNIGLYNIDTLGGYPTYDMGLYELTHKIKDIGMFRVPTLRNLTFTSPYFHDGSAASLSEVIDHYSKGEYKGNGRLNANKHPLIKGFSITELEKKSLISFLLCLSDSSIFNNKAILSPFNNDETRF